MNRRSFFSFLASVPVGIAGIAAAKPIRHPLLLDTTVRTIPWTPLGDREVRCWRVMIDKNMFANFPGKPVKWVEVLTEGKT